MYPLQLFFFKFMLVLHILPICADAPASNAIMHFITETILIPNDISKVRYNARYVSGHKIVCPEAVIVRIILQD